MSGPCDLCGDTLYCGCLEAECRACNGEGTVEHPAIAAACTSIVQEAPHDPPLVQCDDCDGTGWIKCDRGGSDCRFSHCYCEAAWEAQQEANASEPPMSANERRWKDWDERQALRSGRPL